MLYRFTHAASYGEVRADVAEVSAALPPGAVTGAASWLAAENQATGNGAIMEPFVVAFALIGLAMAVLIVGNVVERRGGRLIYADRRAEERRVEPRPGRGRVPEPGGLASAGRVPGRGGGGQPARGAGAAGVRSLRIRRGRPVRCRCWASASSPRPAMCALVAAGRRSAPALRAGRLPAAAEAIAACGARAAGRAAGTPPTGSPPGCACPGRPASGLAAPFARPGPDRR